LFFFHWVDKNKNKFGPWIAPLIKSNYLFRYFIVVVFGLIDVVVFKVIVVIVILSNRLIEEHGE
jgi:hypothetical protein